MEKEERRQHLLENLIYLIIWLVISAVPFLDYSLQGGTSGIDWKDVFHIWRMQIPYFVLYLVNNFILIPYLLIRKRSWLYLLFMLLAVIVTITINTEYADNLRNSGNRPPRDMREQMEKHFGKNDMREMPFPPEMSPDRPDWDKRPHFMMMRRPLFLSPTFYGVMMIVLIIGLNVAVKLLFKSIRDDHRMKELEKQTLKTELEYLKHQINPHFFMNTLNNIHALIDINSEMAKETVLELSKMMRYILYDSSLASVPLEKEILFLNNYIELMKIRYTEKVDICVSLPRQIPEALIPPLLLISFLENAFKHGISYQHSSFIHLSIEIKQKELHCLISNSNYNQSKEQHKGIGLENVKKRLHLLYNDNYTLHIENRNDEYRVLLIIPIEA